MGSSGDGSSGDGEFRRRRVQQMESSRVGELRRRRVQQMGSSGDGEFRRWGVQDLSYQGLTRAVFCVAKAQDTKDAAKQRLSALYTFMDQSRPASYFWGRLTFGYLRYLKFCPFRPLIGRSRISCPFSIQFCPFLSQFCPFFVFTDQILSDGTHLQQNKFIYHLYFGILNTFYPIFRAGPCAGNYGIMLLYLPGRLLEIQYYGIPASTVFILYLKLKGGCKIMIRNNLL